MSRVAEITRQVLEANPLPTALADLDSYSREEFTRRAAAEGITPQAYLDKARVEAAAWLASEADSDAVVKAIRAAP